MDPYISRAGGYLTNPDSTDACRFCSFRNTDEFLDLSYNIKYSHRWRDAGIFVAFIVFNVCDNLVLLTSPWLTWVLQVFLTYLFTYLFRMKRWDRSWLLKWRRKSTAEPQTAPEPRSRQTVNSWIPPPRVHSTFVYFEGDPNSTEGSVSAFAI